MKLIHDPKDLIGKPIKFVDMENYEASIIVTEKNEILIHDFDDDYDFKALKVLGRVDLINFLLMLNSLQEKLIQEGIATKEEFEQLRQERDARRLKEKQESEQRHLDSLKKQYEKLKQQFGEQ